MDTDRIIISSEEAGQRLDKVLAQRFLHLKSRTYFQSLIDEGCVLLNGEIVKKRCETQLDDEIDIHFKLSDVVDLTPEPMDLMILFEDDDLIVINKPSGLVVHPAVGNWSHTLVNGLLYHCKHLPEGDSLRPGIVHRLDKDTSGVIVAAKNSLTHQKLVELFSSRKVKKEYLAICVGEPQKKTIDAPIARHPVHRQMMAVVDHGKKAVTHCKVIKEDGKLSVVEVLLETGRTHQIRVHLKYVGAPVLGDPIYGKPSINQKYGVIRQMLHAETLTFFHPRTNKEMQFRAPLPMDMQAMSERIG